MNTQTKIACMLAGITVLFLISVVAIRYFLIYNNLSLFESQAADKIDYFDQVLQFQQTTLEMFTYDTAVNKAAIAFIGDRDAAELQKTLKDAMPSFGVDAVWIYDADYQLIHHESQLEPEHLWRNMHDPAELAGMFRRGSRYRHFFTKIPGAIVEIRSAPAALLTGNEAEAPHPGTLLAGRLWSNDYVGMLGAKSGADIRILPMRPDSNLDPVYSAATGRLHFSRVMFDENRVPLEVMSVSYQTPLIKAFNRSSNIQIALLMLFGLATVVSLIWCFTAWVAAPLKKISTALRASEPAQVRDIAQRRDEFGTIALLIEDFFRQKDALVAEINERRQVEQALRHSQERFRALVETTSDLIWEVDADLSITYVSPRCKQMFGYEPEELIGKNILSILSPDETQTSAGMAANMFRRREPLNSLVYRARHKDGRLVFIEASAVPVYDDQARFRGYRGIDRDITERRNIEAQLQQALKMEAVGTLAGGIAHDFNNILTVIIGNTQLAQLSVPQYTSVYSNLDQILQASQRASEMVRQILDFSRQAPVEKKPVHISALAQDVLKMLRSSLPSYVTIHAHLACDRDVITANPAQINQIIMNLCVNAAHAMEPDGGTLTVGLDTINVAERCERSESLAPGDYIKLSISDTGCGIPVELLSRIFDPFFTTKAVNKGTGLGLSVVLGIVREHGGDVSVESTPGQGSTFHVLLPLADSMPRAAASADRSSKPGRGGRILAVDDEEQVAHMLQYMLNYLGCSATVTTDSRKALEIFSSDPGAYDLVISDLTMPHLTGEALALRLREIRGDIPIILTTGFSNRMHEDACRSLDIQGCIMKPFALEELSAVLGRVLNRT